MIGLISPLLKIEHQTKDILLCCTMEDVQKKIKELCECESIFLYPFLKAGNSYWTKDINWGHYISNLLKLNWDYAGNLYIIMDGDHHAEMFESCRYLLNSGVCNVEEYAYCYNHAIDNIPDLIKEILSGKPINYSSNLSIASILGSENFEISSDFWQLRIVKIINSINIY